MKIKDSIAKNFRKTLANRRRARRRMAQHKARMLISVSLVAGGQSTQPHEGYTRDVSAEGLAIIVPTLRAGDRYLNSEDCTVRVVLLELPSGPVEIFAIPVRYEELNAAETEEGHLIGLRITEMSDTDRDRYLGYLGTLN